MAEFDEKLLFELGRATRTLRSEVYQEVKEGVDITFLIDFIEKKIFEKGCLPSFPAMISINEMAAHYTVFDEGRVLKKGDVVKVDFGISYKGFITDNAFTVEIGSNKHEKLINTAKSCLDKGLEVFEAGTTMNEIGSAVEEVAKKNGFSTIKNLTGHQIGINNLHFGLGIPNYGNGNMRTVPETSQFAIEPFVTYGEPFVKAIRGSNILHLVKSKPVRDPIAMKLLRHIKENFPKLPFSKRWLVDEVLENNLLGKTPFTGFPKSKVLRGIQILKKEGILMEYDELGTVDSQIVAQFEDCVLFVDGKKTIITRLE